MKVRLIEGGVTPEYPWTICTSDGLVMARFKTAEEAKDWAVRNRFEIDQTEYPHYGD